MALNNIDHGALRNFRDFLQLYNQMSERCFSRCVDNMNSRLLDKNEISCVEDCAQKFINYNNKLMQKFIVAQTDIVSKKAKEAEAAEAAQRELERQSEATDVVQEVAVVNS